MNMFLHELKALRKTTIIWIVSLIAISGIFFSIYPSMVSEAADFKKVLSAYPAAVRAMLGINIDYITSILGFYSMIFSFITLCGTIQAMNIGVSILSKEARERTADFLLVKPVSRLSVVTAKLLAALSIIIVTNVVFYAALLIIVNSVKTDAYSGKLFFMITLTLFFLQLIFLALGLAISVFFRKLKAVLPISLGVVFGLYMIGALITADKNNAAARYISPFRYFDITYIIKHGSYEVSYIFAGTIIIIISIVTAYTVYIKKDINAVS